MLRCTLYLFYAEIYVKYSVYVLVRMPQKPAKGRYDA